jgi:hypothetical protein
MTLFESADSVWELIWDIALAYFIIRISFVYCSLTFLSYGILIFSYNSSNLSHYLPNSLLFPLNILTIILISRLLVYYYEIPRALGFRFAVGLVASILMIISNALAYTVVHIEWFGHWTRHTGRTITAKEIVALWIFALMPAIWMLGGDASEDLQTQNKHGKNGIANNL